MALMPPAICSAEWPPVLFVPIMMTASLRLERLELLALGDAPEDVAGLVAADAEVHGLSGAKCSSQAFLPAPSQPCVMESPRKITSPSPFVDDLEELLVPGVVAVERLGGGVVGLGRPRCGGGGRKALRARSGAGERRRRAVMWLNLGAMVGPWELGRWENGPADGRATGDSVGTRGAGGNGPEIRGQKSAIRKELGYLFLTSDL